MLLVLYATAAAWLGTCAPCALRCAENCMHESRVLLNVDARVPELALIDPLRVRQVN